VGPRSRITFIRKDRIKIRIGQRDGGTARREIDSGFGQIGENRCRFARQRPAGKESTLSWDLLRNPSALAIWTCLEKALGGKHEATLIIGNTIHQLLSRAIEVGLIRLLL